MTETDNPLTDNPLTDKDSQFNPDDYVPDPGKLARGDPTGAFSKGGDWLEGTGLWNDSDDLVKSFQDGDVIGSILGCATVALDVLGAVMDPIGTALSMLVSWMIEHLKPLKACLDGLAGNPTMIQGRAKTWQNISESLTDSAKDYKGSVGTETSSWTSEAGDGYRRSAGRTIDAIGAAGTISEGMGAILTIAGEGVSTVRSTVRDLIADLVSELIVDAIEEACSVGLATPAVVEEALGAIARCTSEVTDMIKKLFRILEKLTELIPPILNLLSELYKIFGEVPDASKVRSAG